MEISSDVSAIMECLEDPAILLGRDYRILLANQAYQEVYESLPTEFVQPFEGGVPTP